MPKPPKGGEIAVQKGLRLLRQARERGEKLSYRRAAFLSGCDRSTLNMRDRGIRQSAQVVNYNKTLLTLQSEKELVRFILWKDKWGFPVTYDVILEKALQQARIRNPTLRTIGKKWVQRFLKRHPEIKRRLSAQLDRDRMKAGDKEVLRDFFMKWQEVIERFGILPEHIYNWDEKGVMLGITGCEWVLGARNKRESYAVQDGNRESVTVIECGRGGFRSLLDSEGNAPASQHLNVATPPHLLPPYIISAGDTYTAANFKYLVENQYNDPTILAGAAFRKSPKGYTDNKIGFDYVRFFDKHTRGSTDNGRIHRLALVDGHSSHLTLEIIEYCMQAHVNIHIICLPAHSTHILQPMDVGVFGPLTRAYKKEVSTWCRDPTNGRMSFAAFLLLYHQARNSAITNHNIQKAFEATGLIPINPRIVLDSRKVRQDAQQQAEIQLAIETADFHPMKPLDPQNLPATPRANDTLEKIRQIGRHHATQAHVKEEKLSLSETVVQLSALLETAVKSAQTAMAEAQLYKDELEVLRNREKPMQAPVISKRSRKWAEEITTEKVLEDRRQDLASLAQEQEAKLLRAEEKRQNALKRAEEEEAKRQRAIIRAQEKIQRSIAEAERKEILRLKKERIAAEKLLKESRKSVAIQNPTNQRRIKSNEAPVAIPKTPENLSAPIDSLLASMSGMSISQVPPSSFLPGDWDGFIPTNLFGTPIETPKLVAQQKKMASVSFTPQPKTQIFHREDAPILVAGPSCVLQPGRSRGQSTKQKSSLKSIPTTTKKGRKIDEARQVKRGVTRATAGQTIVRSDAVARMDGTVVDMPVLGTRVAEVPRVLTRTRAGRVTKLPSKLAGYDLGKG